jgi:hypothetical protein
MKETKLTIDEFLAVLKAKKRLFAVTPHAQKRSESRSLPIIVVEDDLTFGRPTVVLEQQSERPDERKFNVYYKQTDEYYHRYIICLNSETRVITVMRVRKDLQKMVKTG